MREQLSGRRTLGSFGLALMAACGAGSVDAGAEGSDGVVAGDPAGGFAPDESDVLKARFATNSNCTGSQRLTVLSDEILAQEYLEAIQANVSTLVLNPSPNALQQLQFAFNAADFISVQVVMATYAGVQINLANTDYSCSADGSEDCLPLAGGLPSARTNPESTLTRLCPVYFELAERQRASTLIHEITHQNRAAPDTHGTIDSAEPSIHRAQSYQNYAPLCFEGTCL
jgi:hypothetical protein